MFLNNVVHKLYVVKDYVDFRKGHQGLLGESRKLNINIYEGCVVIFISRCRTKVKVLFADATGTIILYKQFSVGRIKTKFNFLLDTDTLEISQAELQLLLEGSAYQIDRKVKKFLPQGMD